MEVVGRLCQTPRRFTETPYSFRFFPENSGVKISPSRKLVLGGGSFEPPFIKLNQVEIRPNIFAAFAACLFEKMKKPRLFGSGIGVPRNHCLIPLFDRFWRILRSVFAHPI